MLTWELLHPRVTYEWLGLLPQMLSEANPKPAKEQLHDGYPHGGGWQPFAGFELAGNNDLLYLDDPPTRPIAQCKLRNELVVLYEHAWVAVIQPDRSFEVCRMD